MKTTALKKISAALFLFLFSMMTFARQHVSEPFTGVKATGVFTVFLSQGENYEVTLETDSLLIPGVTIQVVNDVLVLEYAGKIRHRDGIIVHITAPEYLLLQGSGVSSFKSESPLKSSSLKVEGSGATGFNLDINTDLLITEFSGATNANLSGVATVHRLKASGASQIKAFDLNTETTEVEISGASSAKVYATTLLTGLVSGTSSIGVKGTPLSQTIKLSGLSSMTNEANQEIARSRSLSDTIRVRMGSREVTIVEGENISTLKVKKKHHFKSTWAGFELGINGYATPDQSLGLPPEYNFLELRYEKSIAVNLNLIQQTLVKFGNQVGLFSGIGLGWNNYRLSNDILLKKDSQGLEYITLDTNKPNKNKLTTLHINVPLMMEFQSRSTAESSKFHFSAGLNLGLRISSHTKQVYKIGGKKDKVKTHEDFYINPFRYDLQTRIGWGNIGLFASYSLNSLFRNGKGPELYPFSIGLQIVNFN